MQLEIILPDWAGRAKAPVEREWLILEFERCAAERDQLLGVLHPQIALGVTSQCGTVALP
jgi:hypothetical protein